MSRYGSDADIDRSEVERYLSWAVDRVSLTLHTGEPANCGGAGHTESTPSKHLTIAKGFLKDAVDAEILTGNPFQKVKEDRAGRKVSPHESLCMGGEQRNGRQSARPASPR